MNRRIGIAVGVISALMTAGCADAGAPPSASDPRDGRVTITWSNCATGACIYDWEICIGPDLQIHVANADHTVRDSPACKPRRDGP